MLVQDISDLELESLECPTIHEQISEWNRIIGSLNEAKIKSLIEPLDYDLIKLKHHSESHGIINNIFFLDCKLKSNPFVFEKLVLKIANPIVNWRKYKTTNEVSVMTFLRNNTNIPVPKILSYSNDSSTSLIGCEYVLMEFVNGKCLQDVLSPRADELPNNLIDQFIDIVRQLKSIKLEDQNKIGNFDENMRLHSKLMHGPLCDKFIDYFKHQVEYYINEMKKIKKFEKLANEVEEFIIKLDEIVNNNPAIDGLNFNDQMSIVHNDLNPTNIIVDENSFKITAVIDWEWSMYAFDDQQLDFFKTWYSNKTEKEIVKQLIRKKYVENFEKMNGKEFRDQLEKLIDLIREVTFYLPSYFNSNDTDSKIEYTSDMNVNVRMHIQKSSEKLKNYLIKLPDVFESLKKFKRELTNI